VALLRLVVVLWLLRLVVAVVAEPKPEEAEEAKRYSSSQRPALWLVLRGGIAHQDPCGLGFYFLWCLQLGLWRPPCSALCPFSEDSMRLRNHHLSSCCQRLAAFVCTASTRLPGSHLPLLRKLAC